MEQQMWTVWRAVRNLPIVPTWQQKKKANLVQFCNERSGKTIWRLKQK